MAKLTKKAVKNNPKKSVAKPTPKTAGKRPAARAVTNVAAKLSKTLTPKKATGQRVPPTNATKKSATKKSAAKKSAAKKSATKKTTATKSTGVVASLKSAANSAVAKASSLASAVKHEVVELAEASGLKGEAGSR